MVTRVPDSGVRQATVARGTPFLLLDPGHDEAARLELLRRWARQDWIVIGGYAAAIVVLGTGIFVLSDFLGVFVVVAALLAVGIYIYSRRSKPAALSINARDARALRMIAKEAPENLDEAHRTLWTFYRLSEKISAAADHADPTTMENAKARALELATRFNELASWASPEARELRAFNARPASESGVEDPLAGL